MTNPKFTHTEQFSAPLRYGFGGIMGIAGVGGLVVSIVALATGSNKTLFVAEVIIFALLVAVGFYFVSVKVFVSADDNAVSMGLTPWPRSTFTWGEVQSVEKVDVGFFSAVGIGYRITGAKSRAILARPGQGLRFQLKDGRSLSVVCDKRRDELASLAASHT